MHRKSSILMAIAALAIICVTANATVPTFMNYQGYLAGASGAAIDTTVSITFNIYSTDTSGIALWSSTRLVPISRGLFSIKLGETVSFPNGLFDTPLWIGVTVDTDPEMTPRRALTSVGFAFNANELQGQPAASYDQSSHVTNTTNPHSVTAAQTGAATAADIAALQSQIANLTALIIANTTSIGNNDIDISVLQSQANTNSIDTANNTTNIAANTGTIVTNSGNILSNTVNIVAINSNSVLDLGPYLSLDTTNPTRPTALFDGVNVQIVSGSGSTNGPVNGKGNLFVGYNEVTIPSLPMCSLGEFDNEADCTANGGTWAFSHKSGSHNVVVGRGHNYSRYGGLVVGRRNSITGIYSSVSGGIQNTASNLISSVSGGSGNTASGQFSSVSGGQNNTASFSQSSISGGRFNNSTGLGSSVSGGGFNTASGFDSSVSGGVGRSASGNNNWAAGSLFEGG